MKSVFLLSSIIGFFGVFAAGISWASHILDPSYKAWAWILVISFVVAIAIGWFMLPSVTLLNSALLISSYIAGLGLGLGAFIGYVRFTDAQKWKDAQIAASTPYKAPDEEIRRWQRLRELVFDSKDWGFRFSYVSENRHAKPVSITHDQDIVRLVIGQDENGGALKLFKKPPEQSLKDFLKKTYPDCEFYGHDFLGDAREKFDRYHFPKGYSVLIPRRDCPTIGIEILPTKVGRCFLMDRANPDKYIYLVLPEDSVEAVKPSEKEPFPLFWYDSIRFF